MDTELEIEINDNLSKVSNLHDEMVALSKKGERAKAKFVRDLLASSEDGQKILASISKSRPIK